MIVETFVLWFLLASSVLLTAICSVSVMTLREPLVALHYLSPPATMAGPLLAVATAFGPHGLAGAARATLGVTVLILVNAVVTHATARAIRAQRTGAGRDLHPGSARRATAP